MAPFETKAIVTYKNVAKLMQNIGATLSLFYIQHINKKEMSTWLWHLIVGWMSTDLYESTKMLI